MFFFFSYSKVPLSPNQIEELIHKLPDKRNNPQKRKYAARRAGILNVYEFSGTHK